MKKGFIFSSVLLVCFASSLLAQNFQSDVHLFQNFLKDSPIAQKAYVEPGFNYGDYDLFSTFELGAQGGFPINPDLEIAGALNFVRFNPEVGDGESGLSDLTVLGKYRIKTDANMDVSAGGLLTLPIGSEDVGQGNLNFGAFGALRYPINEKLSGSAVLGLNFIEVTTFDLQGNEDTEYETSVQLGGGVIYSINQQMSLVGELNIMTEEEYTMLSGGLDYVHSSTGRLRGGIGLGLNDGAPDFALFFGYLLIL